MSQAELAEQLLVMKEALEKTLASESDMEKSVLEMFTKADADGNGYIDRQELEMATREYMESIGLDPSAFTQKHFDENFQNLDTDKDGRIDLKEFRPFVEDFFKESIEYAKTLLRELS